MRITIRLLSIALISIGALFGCSRAFSAITSFEFVEVPQDVIPDHRTYDLLVSGTGRLTGVQMLLELQSGSIYQDPLGDITPPSSALFPIFPPLEFDTFVGLGGRTSQTSLDPIIPGGDPITPVGALTFDDNKIDIIWGPPGANPVYDPDRYFVARLTVSDDAGGEVHLLGSTFQEEDFADWGYIEPACPTCPLVIVEGIPPDGSEISLQSVLDDGTGLLSAAIALMDVHPHGALPITIESLEFATNDYDLFSAAVNESDSEKIDLAIDVDGARMLPAGTVVSADLVVDVFRGATLEYRLTATVVPEPSSVVLFVCGVVTFAARRTRSP